MLDIDIRSSRIHRWVRVNSEAALKMLQSELLHLFLCLYITEQDGMGCLNSISQMWPDKSLYKGKKYGSKGREGLFHVKNILRALLVVLTTLSSALSLVLGRSLT